MSRTRSTTGRSWKKLSPKSKVRYERIMSRKRAGSGLSSPYMASISRTRSGSRPRAPRYLLVTLEAAPPVACSCVCRPMGSSEAAPPKRAVASMASPESCASNCSTGPPGTIWITKKLISMMPSSVGAIRMRRRRM